MKIPKRVVDTYGVNVTNMVTGEDFVEKFEVQTYFDSIALCYVLEFSSTCFFTYKSKSSLLNSKKRRIINWLENKNVRSSSLLYHSIFFEHLETKYIWSFYGCNV